MKLDFIKQIMSEFDQSNVTKMKVEIDDLKIELENLNDFERNLIIKRYGQGLTQTEVSQELGINQVKVSREEKQILTRLRTRLK